MGREGGDTSNEPSPEVSVGPVASLKTEDRQSRFLAIRHYSGPGKKRSRQPGGTNKHGRGGVRAPPVFPRELLRCNFQSWVGDVVG